MQTYYQSIFHWLQNQAGKHCSDKASDFYTDTCFQEDH